MRVAFVGKGGAGKSSLAGTFARVLARKGEPVMAIDSDPMPGLAFSLGLAVSDAPLPDELVEERPEGEEGPRFRLRPGLTGPDAANRYAATGPDGVRFLSFGKLSGPVAPLARSQHAFWQILDELPGSKWSLVGDLPAGTRQAFSGWGNYARSVLVVVEPTVKSMRSARRLARMTAADDGPDEMVAVANKVESPDDVEMIRSRTGLDVAAVVPRDGAVADADRHGAALIDHAPYCPAVAAVEFLVDRLVEEEDR